MLLELAQAGPMGGTGMEAAAVLGVVVYMLKTTLEFVGQRRNGQPRGGVDKLCLDHERRLSRLEAVISGLQTELKAIHKALDDLGRKLDEVKS